MYSNKPLLWATFIATNLVIFCPLAKSEKVSSASINPYIRNSPTFGSNFSFEKYKKVNLLYDDGQESTKHFVVEPQKGQQGLKQIDVQPNLFSRQIIVLPKTQPTHTPQITVQPTIKSQKIRPQLFSHQVVTPRQPPAVMVTPHPLNVQPTINAHQIEPMMFPHQPPSPFNSHPQINIQQPGLNTHHQVTVQPELVDGQYMLYYPVNNENYVEMGGNGETATHVNPQIENPNQAIVTNGYQVSEAESDPNYMEFQTELPAITPETVALEPPTTPMAYPAIDTNFSHFQAVPSRPVANYEPQEESSGPVSLKSLVLQISRDYARLKHPELRAPHQPFIHTLARPIDSDSNNYEIIQPSQFHTDEEPATSTELPVEQDKYTLVSEEPPLIGPKPTESQLDQEKIHEKNVVSVIPYKVMADYRKEWDTYHQQKQENKSKVSGAKVCTSLCFINPAYYNYFMRNTPSAILSWIQRVRTGFSLLPRSFTASRSGIASPVVPSVGHTLLAYPVFVPDAQ